MKTLVIKWVVMAVAVWIAAWITGLFGLGFKASADTVGGFLQLLLGVAVLAAVNATLGRLLKLLTLPLNCMTLGLFSLVINALMLQLVGSFRFGFEVENFWAALVGSIVLSIINGLLLLVVPKEGGKDKDD